MLKYIDPIAFLLSLFVGFFLVYSMMPPPKVVVKYPTPENSGKVVYRDDQGVCYKYAAKKVECSK